MLQCRATGFYFRTRVPSRFRDVVKKNEICFSLFTRSRKIALIRAGTAYERTQALFAKIEHAMAHEPWIISDEEKQDYADLLRRSILPPETSGAQETRDSLTECVRSYLDDDGVRNILETIIRSYELEIESLISQYKTINAEHLLSHVRETDRMTALTGYLKDTAEPAMEKLIRSGEILASRIQGHQETIKVFENQSALLRETLAPVFQQLEVKPSPLFSEAVSTFIASKDIKTKPNSEMAMMANVYRRWIEINGDEPIRTYSSRHADKYIEMMSKVPGNYGKGKTKELTVDELIKYAKRNRIKALLTTKTIKNHFSKLSILWSFYEKKELVDRGSNVFRDWSFGRKQKGDGYVKWPDDDLRKLVENPWPPGRISKRTFGMIVGIGSYTGMRLEEICRLRKLDIINIKGVWRFNICKHWPRLNRPAEAWNPKTEAGERVVPIHRKLIEAGILEWANSANYYLFNELTFSGRDKKRSVGFGGKFSTFKNRLGIKSATVVFHSFRHNVSTQLRNTPGGNTGIRELWIDDFLGHEYGHQSGHQSEGVKRYLDGIDLENIVQVAESMQYPDFWDIRTLMGEA